MNLQQTLRRIGQQTKCLGWQNTFDAQAAQLHIAKKLYQRHGLELRLTCTACPEQYDVYRGSQQVAYYRLRHGEFSVDAPDCGGETIYQAEPNGDGAFDTDERLVFLTNALRCVQRHIQP